MVEGTCFGSHVCHTVDIKAHSALANQPVHKGFTILGVIEWGGFNKAKSLTVFLPEEENYGNMEPLQESDECAFNSWAD